MGGITRLRLTDNDGLSYEAVVSAWADAVSIGFARDVFSGHFLISFVTNTNQIENINVSYNDTREIFENAQLSNYTGNLRDVFSVLNNKNVAAYLNAQLRNGAPITPELILETHRLLMFGSIDEHRYHDNGERAGAFKRADYCVGRYSVGVPPEDVRDEIVDLCDLLRQSCNCSAIKLAAVFQDRFENIHPFADGNGRTGRWLTNYLLVGRQHPPVLFTREQKQEYYDALEAYDTDEDYAAMLAYLKRQTVLSWPALREFLHTRCGE